MMEQEKKQDECCTCQADFNNEVNELVENVDGYTKKDHKEKKEEVKDAFANNEQK